METAPDRYFNSLIGREIKGAYRIDRKLGAGGMGAVFEARRIEDGVRVAIKIISPQFVADAKFVKRFQREARVGQALSHPHIVKVFEFGETDDRLLFMVMEFIEGETLRSYLARSEPLALERCMELFKPLCEALKAAHKRNILHRDLKPENILITKDQDGKETLKLADFGLVKLLQPDDQITTGSNLTEVGEFFGTPHYMSPEQLLGHPINSTSDIYSLGVILHQMLTSKLPIEGKEIRQVLMFKVSQDLPAPSEKFKFLPQVFDQILQKALARHPEDRYQTIEELFDDFYQAVKQERATPSLPTQINTLPTLTSDSNSSSSTPPHGLFDTCKNYLKKLWGR